MYLLAGECVGGDLWYIVIDEPTTLLQTFREYGLRFDIEENFLGDKSNGFVLSSSLIRSTTALSRLCLVLAIATLYLTAQGTQVVESGKRRWVDPHARTRQQLSADRLGVGEASPNSGLGFISDTSPQWHA